RAREQVGGYARFRRGVEALRAWDILAFDEDAASVFEGVVRRRHRVGTMDLKIASICPDHDATLLTRNVPDFATVPGLRVENWLV
ncbi:MAG: type II toxin-antitoxin system VapC family toxin, partial [Chthoniobacteraceae bacterium]